MINMNYRDEHMKAIFDAKSIEKTVDDIRTLVKKKIKKIKDQNLTNWKGEASIAFIAELTEIETKLMNEADRLEVTAATIRKVAQLRLEAAENAEKTSSRF